MEQRSSLPGLCYLRLFPHLSPQMLDKVQERLGYYPTMCQVLVVWYAHIATLPDVVLHHPVLQSNGILHIIPGGVVPRAQMEPERSYLEMHEFFSLYFESTLLVGAEVGYCYCNWLEEVGLSKVQISYAKLQLGRFPLFPAVMGYMLSHVNPKLVFISIPVVVSNRLLHVEKGDRAHMISLMWNKTYWKCRVGAETSHPCSGLVSPVTALLTLRNVGIDPETCVKSAVHKELGLPNSALRNALVDEQIARANNLINNHNERLSIGYSLTDQERVELIKAYQNFNLNFVPHPAVHPHALSAAARVCELQEALTMLRYRSSTMQQGSVVLIKDIGGNPVVHLQRKRFNIHSCCPILDARDGQRETSRRIAMNDMLINETNKSHKEKLRAVFTDEFKRRTIWCDRKGQDCGVTARGCVFIHSTYDMRTVDIADSMVRARADEAVITLFYAPEVFLKEKGTLNHQKCNWQIRAGKTIIFNFQNDASWSYEHDIGTYLSLFCTNVIASTRGDIFTTEIVKVKLDVAFIKVTRVHSSVAVPTKLRRFLFFPDSEERIVLSSYKYCPANPTHRDWHFKKVRIVVTRSFYNQVKAYALTLTAARFNMHQVYDFAKSVNGVIVVNGVSVTQKAALDVDDLYAASCAIFIICFQERWEMSQMTKELTETIVNARESAGAGWMQMIKQKFRSIFYGNKLDICTDECEHTMTFLSRFWLWLSKAYPKVDVCAYKWGEPIEVETYVPPFDLLYGHQDAALMALLRQSSTEYSVSDSALTEAVKEKVDAMVMPHPGQSKYAGGGCSLDLHTCDTWCEHHDLPCVTKCNEVEVPGDGNCMYHALLLCLRLDVSVAQLKHDLIDSPACKGACNSASVIRRLNSDEWGNVDVLNVVAHHFRVAICIHLGAENEADAYTQLFPHGVDIKRVVHLRLRGTHYTALLQTQLTKTQRLDMSCKDLFPTALWSDCGPLLQDAGTIGDIFENAKILSVGLVENNTGDRSCLVEVSKDGIEVISGSIWLTAWKLLELYLFAPVSAARKERIWDTYAGVTKLDICRNRAGYKILEMLACYNINLHESSVLELGGAPGAFAQLACSKTVALYHCVTKGDIKLYNDLTTKTRRFSWVYKTISDFDRDMSPRHPGSMTYELVIGDVGSDDSYKWDDSHNLFKQQLYLAMRVVRKHGSILVKHGNFFSCMHHWSDYVTGFESIFSLITIIKPKTAHTLSSEVYVLYKDYSPNFDRTAMVDNTSFLSTFLKAVRVFRCIDKPDLCRLSELKKMVNEWVDDVFTLPVCSSRSWESGLMGLETEHITPFCMWWNASWRVRECTVRKPELIVQPHWGMYAGQVLSRDLDDSSWHLSDCTQSDYGVEVNLDAEPLGFWTDNDAESDAEDRLERMSVTDSDTATTVSVSIMDSALGDSVSKTCGPKDVPVSQEPVWLDLPNNETQSEMAEPITQEPVWLDVSLSGAEDDCSTDAEETVPVDSVWTDVSLNNDDDGLLIHRGIRPGPHCADCQQIWTDAKRDYHEDRVSFHDRVCAWFLKRPEYRYYQGFLDYFALCLALEEDSRLTAEERLDELFSGEFRCLLLDDVANAMPTAFNLRRIFRKTKPLRDEEVALWRNIWQKILFRCGRTFNAEWDLYAKKTFYGFLLSNGYAALFPFLQMLRVVVNDPMYWSEGGRISEWCKKIGPMGTWREYLKNKERPVSFIVSKSMFDKMSSSVKGAVSKVKDKFTDKPIPLPVVYDTYPAGVKVDGRITSTVSQGEKILRKLKSAPFVDMKLKIDDIDKELLRRSMKPIEDVIRTKATQQPNGNEDVPKYMPERMYSGKEDLKSLKRDIVKSDDPLIDIKDKKVLIRDLFVVFVDIRRIADSLAAYTLWAPFVKVINLPSLVQRVIQSVSGNYKAGEYIVLKLSDFGLKSDGLLVVVPTTPVAFELDFVNFVKLMRVDVAVSKMIYFAKPESRIRDSCIGVCDLVEGSTQLSDAHRWVMVVEDYCDECTWVLKRNKKNARPNAYNRAATIMHRNWNDKGVVDNVYRYNPADHGTKDASQKIKTAMAEIIEFWRVGDSLVVKKLIDQWRWLRFPLTKVAANLLAQSSEGFAVWDCHMNKWHCKHETKQCGEYEFVYDGVKLVQWDAKAKDKLRSAVESRYVLVSSDTSLMQDRKLYKAATDLIADVGLLDTHDYSVHLVSGVPGCGKTTKAIRNFYIAKDVDDLGDLILFPTRVACLDFRDRLKKKNPDIEEDYLRNHVMTVDSFLINDKKYPSYKKMIVDEALMLHCGNIFVAAVKAKVKDIYLIGDVKQIPWVNRTSLLVKHQLITDIVDPAEILSVSYRCTLSTAAILSRLYPEGMLAKSSTIREMSICSTATPLNIQLQTDWQYLTYTQADKIELQKRAPKGMIVHTIHEFQGKESDNVCLVRGSTKKHDIYTSEEHNLVAISRHKKKFMYVTPTTLDDKMVNWLSRVKYSDLDALRQYRDLSGGYLPVDLVMSKNPEKRSVDYHDNVVSCSMKWGIPNVSAAFPTSVQETHISATNKLLSNNLQVCLSKLQAYYDILFPGNSCHDLRYLPDVVALSDLELHLENTQVNLAYRQTAKRKVFDNLRPQLRTSMAVNRPVNQIESLLGMVKRNQAAPKLAGRIDWSEMANVLLQCFLKTYIRDDCQDIFDGYAYDPIQCDPAAIEDWLIKQTPSTLGNIERDIPAHEARLTTYSYMIKNKVKPQLDTGAPFTYSAVQTIAYQKKNINALFCPIFKYIRRRLTPILKGKFKIFTDMSHEDFAKEIERDVGIDVFNTEMFLEVDISKYDKSQGEVVLLFECSLMRKFGVPEYWVTLWWNAHKVTSLNDRTNRVSCTVEYQRKSGDASTFIGNTMFLMAVLASLYDLNKVEFGCFAGDDSILIGGDELDVDFSYQCANIFNLEAKFMRNWKYMSFCSKFFIVAEGHLHLVPDPVKLLTKLGRHDVVNWEHLEEYRVSMSDLTRLYGNAHVVTVLARAVSDRYCCAVDFRSMIESLFSMSNDPRCMREMFYSNVGDVLCSDPTRPSFD